jgi:hypothetical protein
MAESKEAWDRVGQDFRALGRQIRERYEQRPRPPASGEPPQGAQVGPEGAEQSRQHGPADRRKVDEALDKLSESLEQAFSALGEAIRDPQFGEQTRKAANSLGDALNATFAEASERWRKR